jgi:hypothetical protein
MEQKSITHKVISKLFQIIQVYPLMFRTVNTKLLGMDTTATKTHYQSYYSKV